MLLVDGTPQSYVDLDDPTYLEFEYVQVLAELVDRLPDGPASVVHLGGAACTLARYVAATRPGSTQVVVEADEPLAELVRAQLGTDGFRLRTGDAREALTRLRPGSSDLVVADVFAGATVPSHLATLETVREAAALLRPGGCYALNVADSGALPFARSQAAALAEVFSHVVVVADAGVLRGRRFGNLVLAGSDAPLELDPRRRARDGRVFASGVRPATDAAPAVVPAPPAALFGR
jgi:spermidine synthase